MKFSFAQKLEMSQTFSEEGRVIPVTKLKVCDDMKVTGVFTQNSPQGYNAIQVGSQTTEKDSLCILGEFRVHNEWPQVQVEDPVTVEQFEIGDELEVQGVSKGKGFAGAVKRHGFSGANATHGTKHNERTTGSIGSGYPEHVYKGRKMPGRAGNKTVTLKNIAIIDMDAENNVLYVKGAVPGPKKALLKLLVK